MKPILEIVNGTIEAKTLNYRPPFNHPDEIKFSEHDFKIMNRLFSRLTLIFPAFKQAWPSQIDFDNAKKEWMRAFKLAKINDVYKIKIGVDRFALLKTPFVPSPGQFIAMCSPSHQELGIPSPGEAWKEVQRQFSNTVKTFSHPVIEHAYLETGTWNFQHLSSKQSETIFIRNYEISIRDFMDGKELRSIPKAIENKKFSKVGSERLMQSELQKMKELLK